jgi:UDP-N-acetylmuramate--alanine ligase
MILQNATKIHCIGIKGAGMTAFAEVLVKKGMRVTGSDTSEVFFTDEVLQKTGIVPINGFAMENIPDDTDIVIYSTAYNQETNIELQAAFSSGVAILSYPEALGELMKEKMGLAVCGTHGKTTTAALLAEVLRAVGEDPLAIVGSKILQWGGNALSGNGKYFVLEADEYQNKLQYYFPFGAIMTSVDFDHPDFFPDFEAYKKVFADFIQKIPHHGVLVSWGDSASVADIAAGAHSQKLSYGFLKENDFQIINYSPAVSFVPGSESSASKQTFEIVYDGESLGAFALQLAGKHNALNAAAVIALCVHLKLDIEKVREGLRNFAGTARRFEYIGEYNGATLYDDYAHHPEEIKVTLKAFRDLYPHRRLVAIFHPHTFTRTKALLPEFAQSFDDANSVYILDIYGSAREKQGGVSSQEIVDLVNTYSRGKAVHIATVADAIIELKEKIAPGDVVITLGAGNVWEVVHALMKDSQ